MVLALPLLVFAFCQAAPPKPPTAAAQEIPRPFARLETMRRMLQKRVEENRGEILGPSEPVTWTDDAGRLRFRALGRYLNQGPVQDSGPVTSDLIYNSLTTASVSSSHAEYVPGLAAIFSLTVPVRTEPVEPSKEEETEVPSPPTANEDDAAWESVERGETTVDPDRYYFGDLDARVVRQSRVWQAQTKLRFAPAAIEALQKTLIDTLWRFGNKLELERGERLAVVVEVQAAPRSPFSSLTPSGMSLNGGVTDSAGQPVNGAAIQYFAAPPILPASFRIVIQVSAEDLKAYREGNLDAASLATRTRVRTYAMAAMASTDVTPDTSGAR